MYLTLLGPLALFRGKQRSPALLSRAYPEGGGTADIGRPPCSPIGVCIGVYIGAVIGVYIGAIIAVPSGLYRSPIGAVYRGLYRGLYRVYIGPMSVGKCKQPRHQN
jgi:hypothetical protein